MQAWRPSILLKRDFQHWCFPENIANAVSICAVAVYYTLKYYMHGSLFFSKNAAVCYILGCYMHGSLFFSENTVVYYILECYMHSSWIQFVVSKLLSFVSKKQ